MRTLDAILSPFKWYRRLRGGKWEHTAACCACAVDLWRRVQVWVPNGWPTVIAREDYR